MSAPDANRLKELDTEDARLRRPEAVNQIRPMDLVFDHTVKGRAVKTLTIVEDATHESGPIKAKRTTFD